MCKWGTSTAIMLTIPRDLSYTGEARQKLVDVDMCIAPLVSALNAAGFTTVASCCGHGKGPGNIALADGRELIIAPDFTTARAMEADALARLRQEMVRALLGAWARHPSTPVGDAGTLTHVYFSVERAVDVCAPIAVAALARVTAEKEDAQGACHEWSTIHRKERERAEALARQLAEMTAENQQRRDAMESMAWAEKALRAELHTAANQLADALTELTDTRRSWTAAKAELAEMTAERDKEYAARVTSERFRSEDAASHIDDLLPMKRRADVAERRAAQAVAALEKHGQHHPFCVVNLQPPALCSCGYAEALAAVRPGQGDKT